MNGDSGLYCLSETDRSLIAVYHVGEIQDYGCKKAEDKCTQTEIQTTITNGYGSIESPSIVELEAIKLDIEILQSRTDALQSFVNTQSASSMETNLIQVTECLKSDLDREKYKTERLEADLRSMESKF